MEGSVGKIEGLVVEREFVLQGWIGLGKPMHLGLEKLAIAAEFEGVTRYRNCQEPSERLYYQCRPLLIAELEKMGSTSTVVLQEQ